MRRVFTPLLVLMPVLLAATPALAFETQALQLREDFGAEPLYDARLQYHYYIPCPTYSWFWAFSGWDPGDKVGEWFQIGDLSTGGLNTADPYSCTKLDQIRVLDFSGYGTIWPGIFSVELEIYCSDDHGCPIGPPLWNSGPWETYFAWNYIWVDPPLEVCNCVVGPGDPGGGARILITATHTGSESYYPAWGADNISWPVEDGCVMHDYGCIPALYPRPYSSPYSTVHSGYFGPDFRYCPPQWFKDPEDPTPDGTQYGFLELAWRIYLTCDGPSASQPATWSSIKSMYR